MRPRRRVGFAAIQIVTVRAEKERSAVLGRVELVGGDPTTPRRDVCRVDARMVAYIMHVEPVIRRDDVTRPRGDAAQIGHPLGPPSGRCACDIFDTPLHMRVVTAELEPRRRVHWATVTFSA